MRSLAIVALCVAKVTAIMETMVNHRYRRWKEKTEYILVAIMGAMGDYPLL